MYFSAKLASILIAVAATAQAAVVNRETEAEISVVFYDDVSLTGAAYSPDGLVQATCTTLPPTWLDRAESVQISPGFSCTFYQFSGCAGAGTTLSGVVNVLVPSLYNSIESFFCSKTIS